MHKKATLKHPKGDLDFYFPGKFTDEAIIDAIQRIRVGERRNWRREFLEMTVVVNESDNIELDNNYKYIVLCERAYAVNPVHRCMVVFPKDINHDYMFEVVQHAVMDCEFEGSDPIAKFSAGFVTSSGNCGGRSETLDLDSHKGDTAVFRETFKGVQA